VVTDETVQGRFSHEQLAAAALAGGAHCVQLREKRQRTTRGLIDRAAAIAVLCKRRGASLVVDDRVDVALAVGAAGVHLGSEDLPHDVARRLGGTELLLGGTANNMAQARALATAPIDYLGVGPVFGTTSKANPAPPLGLAGLRAIVEVSPVPVVAIGGITPERVADLVQAGAFGIAVLSGICRADEPREATARYATALAEALARSEA
jgi:thiamine-phosphate pyrophosphorylase